MMIPPSSTDFLPGPDPNTYLNHLSPQEAREYETTRNALFFILGVGVWDILSAIPDDLKVLKRSRFRSTTFCFIFSRVFAVASCVISSIVRTKPAHNIHVAVTTSAILSGLSLGCSSYLFLRRVRAVYADSPVIQKLFTFFWVIILLSESTLVFSIKPAYIPRTQHFKHSGIQPLLSLVFFLSIAFDSSVFLAISYKIGIAHVVNDHEKGWRRFVFGNALPQFSRAILRGGQQYYLLVCLVNFPSAILLYASSTPPIFKSMFTVLLAPTIASMSCRVYRSTKLFVYEDATTPYPISEIQFV